MDSTTGLIIFIFIFIILIIGVIISIALAYGFELSSREKEVLQGKFFLRSLSDITGTPTYMYTPGAPPNVTDSNVVSINDSTEPCINYSWEYTGKNLISQAGGYIFSENPPMDGEEANVRPNNTDSSFLYEWDYDVLTQRFCLVSDPSFCLFNDNGNVVIKDVGLTDISSSFGWVPVSKTSDKICT